MPELQRYVKDDPARIQTVTDQDIANENKSIYEERMREAVCEVVKALRFFSLEERQRVVDAAMHLYAAEDCVPGVASVCNA